MRIVKAEMLWTRCCPLRCEYCAMVDGRSNSQSVEFWIQTAYALANLGCGFAAFYGAEPLVEDIDKLGMTINAFEKNGIKTTVITSGCVPDFEAKLDTLYQYGLRSLSMSYDIVPLGPSSKAKSSKAIKHLTDWLKRDNVRDAAAIATLTRTNFRELPRSIQELDKLGIWTFFDMIHTDRGQEGCKVKDTPQTRELLFREEDMIDLKYTLIEVSKLKMRGCLCHSSNQFLDLICRENFRHLRAYDWNCGRHRSFPAWLTIDCDGRVYPCDDFQPHGDGREHQWFANRIDQDFAGFSEWMKKQCLAGCPGCLWNTHYDAHMIKEGQIPFCNYVHTKE